MVSRERLIELFDYDRLTGRLVRKVVGVGEKAITIGVSKQGYLMRWVDKKCYSEHALVFMYHHGHFADETDHINGIKTDNRIENLREVSRSQNNANAKKRVRNGECSSSAKGVYFRSDWKPNGKWVAQLVVNGKHHWLGGFNTEAEAALAYNNAAIEHYGDFAKLNEVSE